MPTSPTSGPGGGGIVSPTRNVGQCSLSFAAVSSGPISFVFQQGDATVLDLTDPVNPKPVAAGIYAYTLQVNQDGGGAGGGYLAILTVDNDFYALAAKAPNGLATLGGVTAETTWYSDAGSACNGTIVDASVDTYSGLLYVQKIL